MFRSNFKNGENKTAKITKSASKFVPKIRKRLYFRIKLTQF